MDKRWPEDYAGWTGGFEDLVDAARAILQARDPDTRPLNTRLVRHYQSKGAVGRGQKEGRTAQFSTADLAALLASRGLVNEGWTLSNAASLLSSATPQALTSLSAPPAPDSGHEAVRVVQELLNRTSAHTDVFQGGPHPHLGFLPGSLQGGGLATGRSFREFQPSGVKSGRPHGHVEPPKPLLEPLAPLPSTHNFQVVSGSFVPRAGSEANASPGLSQKYETTSSLAPWLTLALNETDAAAASKADRDRVAEGLEQWARRLRSPV